MPYPRNQPAWQIVGFGCANMAGMNFNFAPPPYCPIKSFSMFFVWSIQIITNLHLSHFLNSHRMKFAVGKSGSNNRLSAALAVGKLQAVGNPNLN